MWGSAARMSVKMPRKLQFTVQTLIVRVAVAIYSGRDEMALKRENNGYKRNLWGLVGGRLGREKDQKNGGGAGEGFLAP